MAQAAGVFKQLAYKKETTYGTVPSAGGAQSLRRVGSDLDLSKDTYQSSEIRTDQQMVDMRHGVRRTQGTINGELSPKTYADFLAAALRRDFSAVADITGLSLTIAASGSNWTVTRGSGSWLTSAAKRGKVIRLAAAGLNAANAAKNLAIVSVTATDLTVKVLNGSALVAEGPIASCTVSFPGKETYAPTSGHTNDSFSVEHWFSDIARSEVFSGCQPSQIDLQLPPTGLATIAIQMMGKDRVDAGAQYFTTPTAATTTGLTAAVNGVAIVGGAAAVNITGLNFTLQSNRTGEPVVGANVISTKTPGRILGNGQFTAMFEDATYTTAFANETELEIIVILTTDNTATSDFVSFCFPRVKLMGSAKNDGEAGIVQTIPFQALRAITGGSGFGNELTTLYIQDSAA